MNKRLALSFLPALFLGSALGIAIATPQRALADAQQQQSFSVWHQMQDCARIAFKQYPDYTPEGNAKRETARQECLRTRRLPVNATSQPTH